jgi:hypothetical protein
VLGDPAAAVLKRGESAAQCPKPESGRSEPRASRALAKLGVDADKVLAALRDDGPL